ncbi:MAG TPA: NADH dehydrogenase subunit [Gammaproteobacteria bacterium]|nr:NADH dehydrogenase subunit [Gammaproteobacteria bacterium]
MTPLDQLLLLSALTVVVPLFTGNRRITGPLATLLYTGQGLLLLRMAGLGYGSETPVSSAVSLQVLGLELHWRFDALSWFFALITIGAGLLSSWFASGEWAQRYRDSGSSLRLFHAALALNVFTMLVLLASGELLSLFIGWELVSWASFLMMSLGSNTALRYAMRYVTYAFAGAMAVLMGLVLVYTRTGSFEFQAFRDAVPSMDADTVWLLFGLFAAGFGVKMALLPFHLWQAKAYAETPGPGAAFLGAISSRMGLFAMIVVLVQIIGVARLVELPVPFTFLSGRDLLAWVAVFTIIFPTFTALRQHDARRLLAWHGIGQGGYMLLGILIADDLGSAGGLMHVFNHATYQAVLFMSVTAVIHRTGTSDLNKLGGLVARMPLSFLAMLIGIIGLAGLPPMNGFVSKWLVYRALILEGSPLLFLGAVIGTLGTILSVYKLIHNTFLGQLRLEHVDIEEAPSSMLWPMMILSTVVFVTGYFPGLVLDWIASVQAAVGLPVLAHHLGGVHIDKGGLDMIWVVSVLLAGFGVGALVFLSGNRSKRVHQLDNYAGGHFLTADTRYQYSDNFYPGLMHLIGPWYRKSFRWLEGGFVSTVDTVSQLMQGLYRHTHPAFYLLAVVVFALSWVMGGD